MSGGKATVFYTWKTTVMTAGRTILIYSWKTEVISTGKTTVLYVRKTTVMSGGKKILIYSLVERRHLICQFISSKVDPSQSSTGTYQRGTSSFRNFNNNISLSYYTSQSNIGRCSRSHSSYPISREFFWQWLHNQTETLVPQSSSFQTSWVVLSYRISLGLFASQTSWEPF